MWYNINIDKQVNKLFKDEWSNLFVFNFAAFFLALSQKIFYNKGEFNERT